MTFPVLTLSSNRFLILTLRQASFDKFRTEQGERIEKHASNTLYFLRQTQDGAGRMD
ncbi:MAG: hypothetical protein LBD67_06475 [Candidatus Accumulibacter sp.]|nr:hypothetical protein [Accumulibacter sp.]